MSLLSRITDPLQFSHRLDAGACRDNVDHPNGRLTAVLPGLLVGNALLTKSRWQVASILHIQAREGSWDIRKAGEAVDAFEYRISSLEALKRRHGYVAAISDDGSCRQHGKSTATIAQTDIASGMRWSLMTDRMRIGYPRSMPAPRSEWIFCLAIESSQPLDLLDALPRAGRCLRGALMQQSSYWPPLPGLPT